jgi:hypothetical protein
MSIMELLKRYQQVWAVLIPHIPVPEPKDMMSHFWQTYPLEFVEKAIARTSKRFAQGTLPSSFNPDDAYKYTGFIAKESVNRAKQLELKRQRTVAVPLTMPGIDEDDNRGNRC